MEMIEQELTVPETDAEKIAWLWDRIEELRQANLNFSGENEILKSQIEAERAENARLRQSSKDVGMEMAKMGIEMNRARAAAASAVEDYRAAIEE